jgi:HlyD family secretion protein
MTHMKQSTLVLFLALTLIAAGLGGLLYKTLLAPAKNERYITGAVDIGDIEQMVSASGTLNPVKLVSVGTQISGVVRSLQADFNDTVKEGQILVELDPSLVNAQLSQSRASLENAKATLKLTTADYHRNATLFGHGYIARADLDKSRQALEAARAQVKSATAQVERDTVNLNYTIIRSPVSGVIISRDIDIGQTVAASFQTPTLFKIAQDLKKMQIDTSLSEADVGGVVKGMKVRFTVDAFPERNYSGIVRQVRLNPTVAQNVVTYNVVIDVDNLDLSLLPGMTAFTTIIEAEHLDVVRVPSSALSFRPALPKGPRGGARTALQRSTEDSSPTVYILKEDKPQPVKITTGISNGKFTELLGGELHEDDQVITEEILPSKKAGSGSGAGAGGSKGGGARLF